MTLRAEARALYATGMSLRAIGRALNVPYDTIRYWCVVTKTPDSHWENIRSCPAAKIRPAARGISRSTTTSWANILAMVTL